METIKGRQDKGTMVYIKEDSLPAIKGSLGRINDVYPGFDSVSRVAGMRTNKGLLSRIFNRICPPHLDNDPVER